MQDPNTASLFTTVLPLCVLHSDVSPRQGFCCYLEENFEDLKERGVVIGYDARAHPPSGGSSKHFARLAAAVFISRGVPVHLFGDITPTPFVVITYIHVTASFFQLQTLSHLKTEIWLTYHRSILHFERKKTCERKLIILLIPHWD